MKPRPLPKKFEKAWRKWPSFDDLRQQNPKLKVHQLRSALEDVPCYRCPDQTARYMPDRAEACMVELRGLEDSEELLDDDQADAEANEPTVPPKLVDAMVLFRQALLVGNDLRTGMATLVETFGRAVQSMTKPMELGTALVESNVKLLADRLERHEKNADRLQLVMEKLMSEQADREMAVIREKNAQDMKKGAFNLAAGYVPTLIQNFKPTAKAAAALKAIELMESEVLDSIVESTEWTEEQREAWTTARDLLRAGQQPPQQNDNANSHNHAASPPS